MRNLQKKLGGINVFQNYNQCGIYFWIFRGIISTLRKDKFTNGEKAQGDILSAVVGISHMRFPEGGEWRCKIPALGKSLGPQGTYFPILSVSRQCTALYVATCSCQLAVNTVDKTPNSVTQDKSQNLHLHELGFQLVNLFSISLNIFCSQISSQGF